MHTCRTCAKSMGGGHKKTMTHTLMEAVLTAHTYDRIWLRTPLVRPKTNRHGQAVCHCVGLSLISSAGFTQKCSELWPCPNVLQAEKQKRNPNQIMVIGLHLRSAFFLPVAVPKRFTLCLRQDFSFTISGVSNRFYPQRPIRCLFSPFSFWKLD